MDSHAAFMDLSALPPLPPSPSLSLSPSLSPTHHPTSNEHFPALQVPVPDSGLRSASPVSRTLSPSSRQSRPDTHGDPLSDASEPLHPRPIATAAEPEPEPEHVARSVPTHADNQLASHLSLLRTELTARQSSLASDEEQFAHTLASSPPAVQSIVDTILTLDDLASVDGPELEKHFHTPGFCLVPSDSQQYFLPMFTAASLPGDSLWMRVKSLAANCVTLGLVTLGMVVEFVLPGVQSKEYYVALKLANVGRRLRGERADVRRAEEVVRIGDAVLAQGR